MKCQLCGSERLTAFLDLGKQPICNSLLTQNDVKTKFEETYPLVLHVCKDCWLVQLEQTAPEQAVFGHDYNYLSGSSSGLITYFKQLANSIRTKVDLKKGDFVVDIGGNDGSFLINFQHPNVRQVDVRLYNVEPTPLPAGLSQKKNIETIQKYFSLSVAKWFGAKAKIITALNVLAHCYNVHDFLCGVHDLLDRDGVFVSQSHYLPALIEQCQYDTVYHEHLRYYTLSSLVKLYRMHDLKIFHVDFNSIYGGSIVVYAKHARGNKRDSQLASVEKVCRNESKYQSLSTYTMFAAQVVSNRAKLVSYITALKQRKQRIVGIGAPMKSATLLNYCGFKADTLDYLTEVNQLKVGMYAPGSHIPIVNEALMLDKQPDYGLLLSWNFEDNIVRSLRAQGYKGGFINPMPQFHVLNEVVSFEDSRGKIVDVLNDEQIEHVNHITFTKDAVRGNHYHKQSIHYDYVLRGRIEFYRQLPYGPVRRQVATEKDLVFTGLNERHALKALEPSEIMVFTRGPRGGHNYETDTYRLSGEECLI